MSNTAVIDDAIVMPKGQVTIPPDICSALGIAPGDRITFVAENGYVRVVNSVMYALQQFQKEMQGQAKAAGFTSEEDVAEWITQSRRRENNI